MAFEELAALVADRDQQLARDLVHAIGEAITLHVREGEAAAGPETADRLTRLREFRDALAAHFPEAT